MDPKQCTTAHIQIYKVRGLQSVILYTLSYQVLLIIDGNRIIVPQGNLKIYYETMLFLTIQAETAAETNRILNAATQPKKTKKKKKKVIVHKKSAKRQTPVNFHKTPGHYRLNLAEIPFVAGTVSHFNYHFGERGTPIVIFVYICNAC